MEIVRFFLYVFVSYIGLDRSASIYCFANSIEIIVKLCLFVLTAPLV